MTKNLNINKNSDIMSMKRAFKMKYNGFFVIFNGLSMKQITQVFLIDDNPTLRAIIC